MKLADHLKLLPSNTGIIGQATGLGMPGFTVETLIAQALGTTPPGGPLLAPADKDKTIDTLTKQLLDIAETTGNVRADGATVAVSADIGGNNDWFMLIVDGLYDREAVAAYVGKLGHNGAVTHDGEMMKLNLEREGVILFPSNKQFILVVANPGNTPIASVVDPVAAALTSGTPNTFSDDSELGKLLKAMDKSGPAWVAVVPSTQMRTEPFFAAFDTITLVATRDKDTIKLTGTAKGSGDIQGAVQQFTSVRDQVLPKLKGLIDISKDFQPLVDAAESVKITSDEKGATVTATVGPDIAKSIVVSIIGEFRRVFSGGGASRQAPPPMPMPADQLDQFDQ